MSSYFVLYAICAVWVYMDAQKRLNHVIGWPLATFLLGPLVLPVYFAKRNLHTGETREGGTAWNILRSFAFFWTITMVIIEIASIAFVSNAVHNAGNEAQQAGAAIGGTIAMSMIFVLWLVILITALVIGLFLKKSHVVETGPTGTLAAIARTDSASKTAPAKSSTIDWQEKIRQSGSTINTLSEQLKTTLAATGAEPWWQTNWFVAALLVLLAPVGAILMWMYKQTWPLWTKILLSVWALIILSNMNTNKGQIETSSNPQVAVQSTIGRVGESFEAGGVGINVIQVGKTYSINRFLNAEPGKLYLVAYVEITSPGRDKTVYNPLYFKVKDANGIEYNPSLLSPNPSLKSGELPKNQRVRGNVAFEIGENVQGLVLSYKPLVLFGGYEEIRIDLGQ